MEQPHPEWNKLGSTAQKNRSVAHLYHNWSPFIKESVHDIDREYPAVSAYLGFPFSTESVSLILFNFLYIILIRIQSWKLPFSQLQLTMKMMFDVN